MRHTVTLALLAATLLALAGTPTRADLNPRPNILWIYVEDMNGWLSCYGDKLIKTPTLDALAKRGVRFERAFTPAGVCSATRSAVITGTMQTTFGIHNHRSARANFRGKDMGKYDAITLPKGVKTVPELFRAAGYHTFNQGKTDYNFVYKSEHLYDVQAKSMNVASMKFRDLWGPAVKANKPFFGQIQLRGGKNTGKVTPKTDPAKVQVMPYYPDHPIYRREVAHHYDCIRQTDAEVGVILNALKADGLLDNTVVVFLTDHGFRGIRHKQFLYDGGIHVPLIIAAPGSIKSVKAGTVRGDLVSAIDLGPTCMAMAGIDTPKYMEGRDVFAADYKPREYVIAARDRCDYTIERIRAVRTVKYKYLRNYLTDRPYLQPQYRDGRDYMVILRTLYLQGKLNKVQSAFVGPHKPAEELYDVENDPHETINLVNDPAHAEALKRHRAILADWIRLTGDKGQQRESDAGLRAALKRWGKKCVNPEYDRVRE